MKYYYFAFIALVLFNKGNAQCYTKVSCGTYHYIATKNDNSVYVGGSGGGPLNNGINIINELVAIPYTTTNNQFIFATAGFFNTFVIRSNGTLWGSGDNGYGSMGTGSTSALYNLTQIGTATNWKQVANKNSCTFGVRLDGSLWGWGQSHLFQTGTCCDDQLSPIRIGTDTDWKMVDASAFAGIALKTNNTLWGWGGNIGRILNDVLS
jgi:alpha-tubulin suppressor-like RCC1 family protein